MYLLFFIKRFKFKTLDEIYVKQVEIVKIYESYVNPKTWIQKGQPNKVMLLLMPTICQTIFPECKIFICISKICEMLPCKIL